MDGEFLLEPVTKEELHRHEWQLYMIKAPPETTREYAGKSVPQETTRDYTGKSVPPETTRDNAGKSVLPGKSNIKTMQVGLCPMCHLDLHVQSAFHTCSQ